MIAALYVDPRGPYFGRPDVDAWDEKRDARYYVGPHPVVAHPPCGPWGRLRHMYKGAEHDCGPSAVRQVQTFGGVLEHPAGSKLWLECQLPEPDEIGVPAFWSGHESSFSIAVEQVSWGHVARKRTWLYFCDVDWRLVVRTLRTGGEPTHWVSGDRKRCREKYGRALPPGIKHASAEQRRRTPPLFADWLISLAESVERRSLSTQLGDGSAVD